MDKTKGNKMTKQQTIKRLTYLQGMIVKYAHRWNQSDRLDAWVCEYNLIRDELYGWESTPEQNEVWFEFCNITKATTGHTGYDCLA
jgi:3-methyladenine DNA glycosylase AlkD